MKIMTMIALIMTIALLKLADEVTEFPLVTLASPNYNTPGTDSTVVGWGNLRSTEEGGFETPEVFYKKLRFLWFHKKSVKPD